MSEQEVKKTELEVNQNETEQNVQVNMNDNVNAMATETEEKSAEGEKTIPTDDKISAEEKINEEELEEMKKRVKEMEAEAAKIMEMNEEATNTTAVPDSKDIDSRSVYVGNVDYTATPEELQTLFQPCGNINRITIIHDRFTGHPKGYAYIEFEEAQSVQSALIYNGLVFKERPIKVLSKRTNLPGMAKRGRGAYRGGYRGYRGGFYGRGRGAYRGYYAPY